MALTGLSRLSLKGRCNSCCLIRARHAAARGGDVFVLLPCEEPHSAVLMLFLHRLFILCLRYTVDVRQYHSCLHKVSPCKHNKELSCLLHRTGQTALSELVLTRTRVQPAGSPPLLLLLHLRQLGGGHRDEGLPPEKRHEAERELTPTSAAPSAASHRI